MLHVLLVLIGRTVYQTCEEAAESGVKFDYSTPFPLPFSAASDRRLTWSRAPVVCSNKALLDATPSLADQLAPVVSAGTSIVLFQNGVGAEEPLHGAFPGTPVISACVSSVLSSERGISS